MTIARKQSRKRPDATRDARRREREKRFGLSDPAVWDVINRSLTQQKRLSSLAGPVEPHLRPVKKRRRPRIPSRTSSQYRALNRFARQLEKYAYACEAAGSKAPIVTPTESESKASLHTVEPLLPYHKEFQSAGLAVTSSEQIHKPPTRLASQTKQPNHGTQRVVRPEIGSKLDGQNDSIRDSASTSTGSYILFTDPNDLSAYLIDPLPEPKSRPERKPKCTEGLKLPWLKSKPTAARPSESHRTVLTKDAPKSSRSQIQAENPRSSVPHVSPTRPRTQTTRCSKSTPPEHREKRRYHSSHVVPAEQPVVAEKRKSHLHDAVSPQKTPCVEVSTTKPREKSHHRNLKLEVIPSQEEVLSLQPPPKHPLHVKRARKDRLLPRSETIREESKASPESKAPCAARLSSAQPIDKREPTTTSYEVQHEESPETNISSVPTLPSVAALAATRESSIERALDAVMKKLDAMEKQTTQEPYPPHVATLQEKTNLSKPLPTLRRAPDQENLGDKVTIWPSQPDNTHAKPRKLSRQSIGPPPKSPAPEPSRKPSVPSHVTTSSKGKAPAAISRDKSPVKSKRGSAVTTQAAPPNSTEQKLRELDVFFDNDDAAINDKDVLQGLQVAVHAAADDFYDSYIRYKTGMRIRRFLADLKSVDGLQRQNLLDQTARERQADTGKRGQTRNGKDA